MATPKVIAICSNGHGAGKSTLSDFIIDAVQRLYPDKNVGRTAFARPLKAVAGELLSYAALQNKDTPCDELNGKAPRDLFVKLGQMLKMEYGQTFFSKRVIERIDENPHYDLVVIDDLRFPSELCALKEKFGDNCTTVYVCGALAEEEQDPSTEGLIHYSDCDDYIDNDDTYGALYDAAVALVKGVFSNERIC